MAALTACPVCGRQVRPTPIVYGYPAPETFEAASRAEVALGGCVIVGREPTARCPECGTDLVRIRGQWTAHDATDDDGTAQATGR